MMQKRYRSRSHDGIRLPMTDADLKSSKHGPKPVLSRRRRPDDRLQFLCFAMLFGVLLGGIGLMVTVAARSGSSSSSSSDPLLDARRLQFTSLAYALKHSRTLDYALKNSRLVGVYFAASWCKQSTPVTELIDSELGKILLSPPSPDQPPPGEKVPLSIVYVSSDRSVEEYSAYKRANWLSVPFEHTNERKALKKHFKVCAKPEVIELGIERTFEIPTLLIIDSETHDVITTNGAEDLKEFKDLAYDHWMGLHDLIRAMEEKYSGEGLAGAARPVEDKRIHHFDSFSSLFA